MPKRLKKHEAVGADYLEDRGRVQALQHDFDVSATQLWNSLKDADAWTHWLPITKVVWTSPEPFEVGTTRTVEIGEDRIEEVFFTWEEGRRMGFRFDQSTLPIKAFAEDYLVEPIADGARLTWTFRVDASFLLRPILNSRMKSGGRSGFPKLEALIKSDPARFA